MKKPSDLAGDILSWHARGASTLILFHLGWGLGGNDQRARVMSWEFAEGDNANELAKEILRWAEDDAAATGGTQQYGLWGYADAEARVQIGRARWRVHVETESDSQSTEPPHATGQIAFSMRHIEAERRSIAIERQQLASERAQVSADRSAVIDALMRTLKDKSDDNAEIRRENRKLMTSRLEWFVKVEELTSQKQEREIQATRELADLEDRRRLVSKLEPAAAMLVNKMMGVPGVPKESASTLDELLASIDPKQMEELLALLSPEQRIVLSVLWKERAEAHAAAEKQPQPEPQQQEAAP